MKRIQIKLSAVVLLLGMFICSTAVAQEEEAHEIRIKIQKEMEGKMKQIDTILRLHEDSLRTYWYSLDHEKLDSLREALHRKMEFVEQKHMREIREKMERMRPEMERLRDSMKRHRIEVILPQMRKLDSLRREGLQLHLENLDSLHRKMIIRIDSLDIQDMDIDVNIDTDSIQRVIRKSLRHLDSLDIGKHLSDLDLQGHVHEGLRHAYIWIDEDLSHESYGNGTDLKYLDGKVLKIKTDPRGRVVKVIILSPDGETLEVKEGKEAREFITRDGERVTISEVEE